MTSQLPPRGGAGWKLPEPRGLDPLRSGIQRTAWTPRYAPLGSSSARQRDTWLHREKLPRGPLCCLCFWPSSASPAVALPVWLVHLNDISHVSLVCLLCAELFPAPCACSTPPARAKRRPGHQTIKHMKVTQSIAALGDHEEAGGWRRRAEYTSCDLQYLRGSEPIRRVDRIAFASAFGASKVGNWRGTGNDAMNPKVDRTVQCEE
ncbi:hypothetical protein ANO11243_044370 [Dothideomycetidae sp. 11243]|nr:hypothetical protein ANO11243_044370 [fungal sp. No.11243]